MILRRYFCSDIKVTNQYLHCISEVDEAAANVLQDILITQKTNSEQENENHIIMNYDTSMTL